MNEGDEALYPSPGYPIYESQSTSNQSIIIYPTHTYISNTHTHTYIYTHTDNNHYLFFFS